jgi:hypothetical protein
MVVIMKQWTTEVQYDDTTDSHFIILPDDLLDTVDLSGGDDVEWIDNKDGSWSIKRVDYTEDSKQLDFSSYDEIIEWPLDLTPVDSVVYDETMKGLTKLTPVKAGWSAQFILNTK